MHTSSLFLFKTQKRKVEAEFTLVTIKRTYKRGWEGGGIYNEWWLEAYNRYMKLLRMQQLAIRSELATVPIKNLYFSYIFPQAQINSHGWGASSREVIRRESSINENMIFQNHFVLSKSEWLISCLASTQYSYHKRFQLD